VLKGGRVDLLLSTLLLKIGLFCGFWGVVGGISALCEVRLPENTLKKRVADVLKHLQLI
jgi:hypothetical protein